MHQWNIYNTFDQAAKVAADFLANSITECIKTKGVCHVILPGGNTPVPCLELLAYKKLPWDKVHWYPGDERCCPQDHIDRNDRMLENHFWSLISKTYIHHIPAELGAEKAAEFYREEIKAIEAFDIAFLGIGEDGHTASLFSGNSALDDHRSVVPVYDSPKPPPERVSLSIETLKKTGVKIVLVNGKEKSSIIALIKKGESLPINSIGDIHWFIDSTAATLIT